MCTVLYIYPRDGNGIGHVPWTIFCSASAASVSERTKIGCLVITFHTGVSSILSSRAITLVAMSYIHRSNMAAMIFFLNVMAPMIFDGLGGLLKFFLKGEEHEEQGQGQPCR